MCVLYIEYGGDLQVFLPPPSSRNCQQVLKLSNPLGHPVTFFPSCTNTRHFIVLGHREGQVGLCDACVEMGVVTKGRGMEGGLGPEGQFRFQIVCEMMNRWGFRKV